jgi:hypothetical protein
MLKQYIEYKEMKQLRKDHMAQKKLRYAVIFFAIAMTLLIAMAVIEAVTPAGSAKPSKVEQPVGKTELSDQEIQELTSKQAQYCLQINQHLPEPRLTKQIGVCERKTSSWTITDFDALLGAS